MASEPNSPELMHPGEDFSRFGHAVIGDHKNASEPSYSFPQEGPDDGIFPWPEGGSGTTAIRYIFWRHIEENGEELAKAIQGADVVALEAVATADPNDPDLSNKKVEIRTDRIITNHLLGAELTPDEEHVIKRATKSGQVPPEEERKAWFEDFGHIGPAYISLIGSGVRCEWLNVEYRHSSKISRLEQEEESTRHKFSDHVVNSGASFNRLMNISFDGIRAQFAPLAFREKITEKQLEKITQRYAGANIAVVYGAAHTLMSRMITMPNVHMQRLFLPDHEKPSPYESIYKNTHAIRDIVRVTDVAPEIPLRYHVLDRIVLYEFSGRRKRAKKEKYIERYNRLTPEDKENLLEQVMQLWQDEIPENKPGYYLKILKRHKATKKIIKATI